METIESDHGTFTVGQVLSPPQVTDVPVIGYRNPWTNSGLESAQAGVFTVLLDGGVPRVSSDFRPVPKGDGYATMRLSAEGKISWQGRMADGSVAIGSTDLLELGRIPLFLPLAWKGVAQGWLNIPQVEPFNRSVLQGSVVWDGGGPRHTRAHAAGFSLKEVTVAGGTYNPPAKGALLPGFSSGQPNATLFFDEGGLDGSISGLSPSLTLLPSGDSLLPPAGKPSDSLTVLTLGVSPATGMFNGRFRVATSSPGAAVVRRDVAFQGVLVQRLGGGAGYFLMPQLPVAPQTLKTSPILSGQVSLQPFSIGTPPGQ
jgi:hypothetical protein